MLKPQELKLFARLDLFCRILWVLFPITLCYGLYWVFEFGYFTETGDECSAHPIKEFSLPGKVLASIYLGINIVLYALLLAFIHHLIRKFRQGEMFVESTLEIMKSIAFVLMAWPFIEITLYNLVAYSLNKIGDLKDWDPSFYLELVLLALGGVILALRLVIAYAIKLHKDAEMTV